MKLSQFRFKLPEELIAQHASEHRDEARMMVVHRASGEI
ncbi:S-adenosylmethionine:tRNA ribosyltransferase-isomerase, partial [Paramuribaculum intestinale]